jgi:hypothetical protein
MTPEEEEAYDAEVSRWLDWSKKHPAEAEEINRRYVYAGDEPRPPKSFPPRKQEAPDARDAAQTA